MTRRILLVLVASLLVGAVPKEDGAKVIQKDEAMLQGRWRAIGGEVDGEKVEENKVSGAYFVFKGNTLVVEDGGRVNAKGVYRLDPTRSPKTIDIIVGKETG